jgi:hypothetical protein
MSKNKDRAHFVWMECLAAAGDLSPALRLLGIRLALHRNLATGRCFVGYETLAREVSILTRSAKKLVAQLERHGWIRIKRGGGREKANEYEFTIPEALNGVRVSESETVSGEALNGVPPPP